VPLTDSALFDITVSSFQGTQMKDFCWNLNTATMLASCTTSKNILYHLLLFPSQYVKKKEDI